ncbi:MAG: hypothetical protein ACYDDO_11490 [Acidiferrobacterales bacterium]
MPRTLNRYLNGVALIALITLLLVGCISIQAPGSRASIGSPVPVHIIWGSQMRSGTFKAQLDNQDVTSLFIVDYSQNRADAALALTPGAHQLNVSGSLWSTLLQSYSNQRTSRSFNVSGPSGGFAFTLQPAAALFERGGSGDITINITRTGSFHGDVSFSAVTPGGVTVNAPHISTGQSTGTLSLTVDNSSEFAISTLSVTGQGTIDGNVATQTRNLDLTVARKAGAFVEASPDFRTVGQSKNSPDNRFLVTISRGSQVASPADYAASFKQGVQTLGAPVGFYLDTTSNLGGAGFCPASNIGVVLSGQASRMAQTSQHLVTFMNLATMPYPIVSWPVDSLKGSYAYQPRIFFSPDCTLALVAGANNVGMSNNVLYVIDLLTGNPVGHGVDFNSKSFSASVINAKGRSMLQVTADNKSYHFPL